MQVASRLPDPKLKQRPKLGAGPILAGIVGALFLFPAVYLAFGTFDLGGDLWSAVTSRRTLIPLRNSIMVAVAVTALAGTAGTLAAWAVSRTDIPGRRLLKTVLPLPLVIPSFVGASAYLAAFGPGGLVTWIPRPGGFWGSTILLSLLTYPYVYLPVLARLTTTTASLEEAARMLDGNFINTARNVVWPQIRGSVNAGMLLVFLYVLSDFGAVSLMRYDTITRAIFSSRLFDRAASLTLGLILAILALIVAGIGRRTPPASHAAAGAAMKQPTYSLSGGRIPTFGAVWALVAAGFIVPIVVFVTWVLRGAATVGVGYSGLGDDLGFLVSPLVNSTVASVVAAVVAVFVVLPVAYVAGRRRHWIGSWAATTVSSVFALPGLVVALAIVFWALQAPGPLASLYQTFPLLILAYVLHFGAQSLTSTQVAVAALPKVFDEAAQTLGADAARRFRTIELPLILPAVLAGGGLVMLSTLKELPATLLLAPIGFQTLATQIWGAAEDGFFAEVGVTSLVLIALSWALTWLLVLRNQRH